MKDKDKKAGATFMREGWRICGKSTHPGAAKEKRLYQSPDTAPVL